ncbi:hypothetical protein ElyMa_003287600 [Elysia marginata]|uniref:Uncharacterized protein n=1 Tax=Elysia marginata TaxID=1093978 RepID=A0AAV4J989_9GAST|nr:hypothetical protein ElyMa_003287600 [Elysia marginata]
MPQQTSTFEGHFKPICRVLQAHITNSKTACSWVPILQVDGLRKVMVNCFLKDEKPRPSDLESNISNHYAMQLPLELDQVATPVPLHQAINTSSSSSASIARTSRGVSYL